MDPVLLKLLKKSRLNSLLGTILFWLLLSPLLLKGQDTRDTTASRVRTQYTTLNQFRNNPGSYQGVDTSLDFIQRYNPIYQRGVFRENLGNYGSPSFSLKFEPFTDGTFYTGMDHYDIYRYNSRTIPFYDSYTPFTNIRFNQRFSGNQEDINGVHARNITPFWNAAIHFTRRNSQGLYLNQETDQTRVGLNSHFQTPNGRYHGFVSGILNNFENQENGGLSSLKDFRNLTGGSRNRASVRLSDAREKSYQNAFNYDHFFFLGAEEIDTVFKKRDTFVQKTVKDRLHFYHNIGLEQFSYGYADNDLSDNPGFYPNIYSDDSSQTRDTFYHSVLTNEFAISNFNKLDTQKREKLRFRAGAELNFRQFGQGAGQENFENLRLKGKVRIPFGDQHVQAKSQFFPVGRYQGDFKSHQVLNLKADSMKVFRFGHKIQSRHPALLKTQMRSNHLKWDNDFKNPLINRFYAQFDQNRMNLEAKVHFTLMNNYVFYGSDIQPQQREAPVRQLASEVNHHYQIGPFHLANDFLFQYSPENDILNLPEWAIRSSLFYKNYFFDRNLQMSMGIDFRYNKQYFAKSYFPEYNLFHIQSEQTIGGYPFFDFFLNFRIGQLRGFFKVQHLNSGFTGDNYLVSPGYPIYPRTFGIGIRWMFFD